MYNNPLEKRNVFNPQDYKYSVTIDYFCKKELGDNLQYLNILKLRHKSHTKVLTQQRQAKTATK